MTSCDVTATPPVIPRPRDTRYRDCERPEERRDPCRSRLRRMSLRVAGGSAQLASQLHDQAVEQWVNTRPERCMDRRSPHLPTVDQGPPQQQLDQLQVEGALELERGQL